MPENEINAVFTDNIKKLLTERNMSYAELAANLGVGKSTVSMWMSGKSLPRMELLDALADIFNVSVNDLTTDRIGKDIHVLDTSKMSKSFVNLVRDVQTDALAAHFDGSEYTEEELEEIKKFAEFVKSKRKDQK